MQNNTFFGEYRPFNTIVLNKTTSTNDYLKELLANFKPLPAFSAIMTKNQTNGRGQRGTVWLAEPNTTLATSILLKPKNMLIQHQFLLTVISSLAVLDSIASFVDAPVSIKWPNDIYINNKKVCGILIENKLTGQHIASSIVGIGVNVSQTSFPEEINQKAVSIKIINNTFDTPFIDITKKIQLNLAKYESILETAGEKHVLSRYNEHLFQRNQLKPYRIKDTIIQGTITQVEIDGLLQVNIEEKCNKYDLKEIAYIL